MLTASGRVVYPLLEATAKSISTTPWTSVWSSLRAMLYLWSERDSLARTTTEDSTIKDLTFLSMVFWVSIFRADRCMVAWYVLHGITAKLVHCKICVLISSEFRTAKATSLQVCCLAISPSRNQPIAHSLPIPPLAVYVTSLLIRHCSIPSLHRPLKETSHHSALPRIRFKIDTWITQ